MYKTIISFLICFMMIGCDQTNNSPTNGRDRSLASTYFGVGFGLNLIVSDHLLSWGQDGVDPNEFDIMPSSNHGYCSNKKLLSICMPNANQPYLSFDPNDWDAKSHVTIESNWHEVGSYDKCAKFFIKAKNYLDDYKTNVGTIAIFCDGIGLVLLSKFKASEGWMAEFSEDNINFDTFILNSVKGAFSDCKLISNQAPIPAPQISVQCYLDKQIFLPAKSK